MIVTQSTNDGTWAVVHGFRSRFTTFPKLAMVV